MDKSLVVADERDDAVRYRLLEIVRQYGRERLLGSADAADVFRRHADFFVALAAEAEPHFTGAEQAKWLDCLETEHANLRVALEWSLGPGEVEAGLRLAGALYKFWEIRGHFTEGRKWSEAVLARVSERTAERAKVLYGAGILAWHQGDYAMSRQFYDESLVLRRELGDRRGIAAALNGLGLVAWNQGDYALARSLYEESLAIFRQLADKRGIGVSLGNLGIVARAQGDYASARAFHDEGLAMRRELGDRLGTASALHNLGLLAWNQGDYTLASSLYAESLALSRELGDKRGMAATVNGLGTVARTQGDYARARSHYRESLTIFRELGDKWGIADVLEGCGCLAAALGSPEWAARTFGAAEALREAIRAPLPPPDRADYQRHVATARDGLQPEEFAAAWAAGRSMVVERVIEDALDGVS